MVWAGKPMRSMMARANPGTMMMKATLRGATMRAARRSMPLTAWSTTVSMSAIFHRPLMMPHLLFLAWAQTGEPGAGPSAGH
jgi:hypothetical protein